MSSTAPNLKYQGNCGLRIVKRRDNQSSALARAFPQMCNSLVSGIVLDRINTSDHQKEELIVNIRAIVDHAYKIAYVPVPKIACSSLTRTMYFIENNKVFDAVKLGYWAHDYYRNRLVNLSDVIDYNTFVVVRDPIERLMSAYVNRVIDHGELSTRHIKLQDFSQLGLKPDPDPTTFFMNLCAYRNLSRSINHHTNLICSFIGEDLALYRTVYKFNEMDRIFRDLSTIVGRQLSVEHFQKSSVNLDPSSLPGETYKAVLNYCQEDYDLLSDYY